MFDKFRSLLALPKKEVRHDVGLAFIAPVLKNIKSDIDKVRISFDNIDKLIGSGFKIGFDKIPAEQLSDLIEKTKEVSAMVEASDTADKVRITELLAEMHDDVVKCSALTAFLVNSDSPDDDFQSAARIFRSIDEKFRQISGFF
ncbi:hypothetical protein GF358_00130 [Candidatus Woesearchaeota archaeon]|nr:hypothetical protein [Candidatus Woesearchaeota archaeon]